MDINKIVTEFTKDIMQLVSAAMEGQDLDNNKSSSDICKNIEVKGWTIFRLCH